MLDGSVPHSLLLKSCASPFSIIKFVSKFGDLSYCIAVRQNCVSFPCPIPNGISVAQLKDSLLQNKSEDKVPPPSLFSPRTVQQCRPTKVRRKCDESANLFQPASLTARGCWDSYPIRPFFIALDFPCIYSHVFISPTAKEKITLDNVNCFFNSLIFLVAMAYIEDLE